MEELVLSPSDFVAFINQTLETAYPRLTVEGELSEFRVSKRRWVYFKLKDEAASIDVFGSVHSLPGPLRDGLLLRVGGQPRLHQRFGFSLNADTIAPVGEGSIKQAADLLARQLAAEGLFAPERKRRLPPAPRKIGLVTAAGSAAYHDFIKILDNRWAGVEILVADSYVQGDKAPASIINAVDQLNQLADVPDLLVVTRGGGSAEDRAAFNDERVVRAIAASRVPTLIAIGHEVDISLAEMAADAHASTPSNAAQLAVPDKAYELRALRQSQRQLARRLAEQCRWRQSELADSRARLAGRLNQRLAAELDRLAAYKKLVAIYDPKAALKRGYAILSKAGRHIYKTADLALGDQLSVELADGKIGATVTKKHG